MIMIMMIMVMTTHGLLIMITIMIRWVGRSGKIKGINT